MTDTIITISREYGSGGREIGRLLAEELGLPLFDKEIMHMAIERSGMTADFVEKHGEKVTSKFLQNLQRLSPNITNVRIPSGYSSLAMVKANAIAANSSIARNDADRLFRIQSSAIRENRRIGRLRYSRTLCQFYFTGSSKSAFGFYKGQV